MTLLPPTSSDLLKPETKPYFLWWLDCTTAQLIEHLKSGDLAERAYYLGALLREANTRDVWLFTDVATVRSLWPHLSRHLGKSRARWAWLLDIPEGDQQREPPSSP